MGSLADACRWAIAPTNLSNCEKRVDMNQAMNEATLRYFDEQRRECNAHKARQLEIDAAEVRRLEHVRASRENGKLYDWHAWDARKMVHPLVPIVVGQKIRGICDGEFGRSTNMQLDEKQTYQTTDCLFRKV